MELDKTEITIRERSTLELLDLSLVVIKRHAWPLTGAALIVGGPMMLTNVIVTAWMVNADSLSTMMDRTDTKAGAHWRHSWHLLMLWCLEFPLASLPITIYLGGQTFFEQLSLRKLIRRLQPLSLRSVYVLGLVRLGLAGLVAEAFVRTTVTFDPLMELLIMSLIIFGLAMAIRAFSPFAPEILGLEACPLKSTDGKNVTYWRRANWLHQAMVAEHIARFVACAVAAVCIGLMILSMEVFVLGVTLGRWQWSTLFDHLLFPLTLWATGIFVAVFRFLAYLDTRIRLEGWEVELQLRAEAQRMENAIAPPISEPVQEVAV